MEEASAAVTVDTRSIVTCWSEGARRLTGHPAEDAVGRPVRELLTEHVPAGSGPLPPRTVEVRHRDGHPVLLRLAAQPLLDARGAPAGHVITVEPSEAGDASLAGLVLRQAPLGMSLLDTEQRYLRVNDVACRMLGTPESDLVGRGYLDIMGESEASRGFSRHLRRVVETGEPVHLEDFTRLPTGTRLHAWHIEMWPVRDTSGTVIGTAVAALDSNTQLRARERLVMLNEAAARIGTTLDVVRTAEELVEILAPGFADFAAVDLLDEVIATGGPPDRRPDGFPLRRVAHRSATEGTPESAVRIGEIDGHLADSVPARDLREGRAVLRGAGDPDFDRWLSGRGTSPREEGPTVPADTHSLLSVPLRARGTTLGVVVAARTTHPDAYTADDTLLAEELASRAAVCVDNARRFVRERTTALALQRSLLPKGLPGQAAVEVAHRYLPSASAAGIGGDWFDVIPLAGSRVGLVVGDVVGHGIPSTAAMGRLFTAVRTLADVDLPPDELLTHLDDLVLHLATDESGEDVAELGATCLYAVYDPVSRLLTVAAAGHPPPAVVLPDGTSRLLPVNTGPPLGVGGLPFEATELRLPEGSVVALYTDGLMGHRDLDHATEELRRALTAPADSLDALCDSVLKAVLPEEPDDDVALLLARTRALGADRVATREVRPDPEEVAAVREWTSAMLSAWELDEIAFVTELVVSELVTNAIRYGVPPVQLRLIRDRTLICEVSDASSTSPHLRRAHVYDEGGRGLLLVAQLTQRWGSRQTDHGKTIWAEQPLPRR
ncbi:SpoIIE family protein phosphatase [Streptomyces griseoflavus]|uniref:SpoIIE family protein phosphatase n=1 Tax=Streptomyces griseoflavus TaxID=35619 RepID=UPI00167D3274|nr:SpoIIE family protein phosphatase [Streptomyces griseoflavus]